MESARLGSQLPRIDLEAHHTGVIKRIRQACSNCRRRETKCSGEKPQCVNCRRIKRSCHYEPYSATSTSAALATLQSAQISGAEPGSHNAELLQRIKTIESQLARLSKGHADDSSSPEDYSPCSNASDGNVAAIAPQRRHSSVLYRPWASYATHQQRFNTLPPHSIVEALIDAYFVQVHNQPYAYFHEDRFRRNLEGGLLPKCLIFAVIASSLRFTDLDFYRGSTAEATTAYAREAWLSVLNDHMTTENSPSLHVAQTLNILAIIDFTSGRISSGWLKIGLAIRIAQDLQLMKEPSEELSSVEREEHRRVFWSIYLLDKLVSCGKSRTPAISDEDCHVQLPCDEDTFRKGEHKNTATLDDLHQWNAESISACGNFALALLVGSALGRCARYVLHERRRGEVPPWDSSSKMASINSFLLVVESHLKIDEQSIGDIIAANQLSSEDDGIDHQAIAHVIFARAIFHLCHILLNHPFLLRLHLPEQSDGAPPSFLSRAFRTGAEHARQLARFLVDAANAGCHVASSFYAYSIAVAGSVLILHSVGARNRTPHQRAELDEGVQHAIDTLDRMGMIWRHASKMKTRLQSFKQHAHIFASILDPHTSPKLDIDSELALWSMVDYGTMCSEDQLIMPAQSVSATNSESEEVPRSTSSATLAIDARGQQPGDLYLPTYEMAFDNAFDIPSLDYLLDLAPGGSQV